MAKSINLNSINMKVPIIQILENWKLSTQYPMVQLVKCTKFEIKKLYGWQDLQ